jgi:hypothetical protein
MQRLNAIWSPVKDRENGNIYKVNLIRSEGRTWKLINLYPDSFDAVIDNKLVFIGHDHEYAKVPRNLGHDYPIPITATLPGPPSWPSHMGLHVMNNNWAPHLSNNLPSVRMIKSLALDFIIVPPELLLVQNVIDTRIRSHLYSPIWDSTVEYPDPPRAVAFFCHRGQ